MLLLCSYWIALKSELHNAPKSKKPIAVSGNGPVPKLGLNTLGGNQRHGCCFATTHTRVLAHLSHDLFRRLNVGRRTCQGGHDWEFASTSREPGTKVRLTEKISASIVTCIMSRSSITFAAPMPMRTPRTFTSVRHSTESP